MESPSADRIPQEEAAHRSPNRPVALRPSRRPLLWAVPVAVIVLVAGILGIAVGARLVAMFAPVLLFGVFLVAMMLKLLRGRTEADSRGIRNRLVRRTRVIPWGEVTGLHVLPTLFGRSVVVSCSDSRRYSLAAPREGLLSRDPRFDEALEAMTALAPRAVEVKSSSMRAVRITVWIGVTVYAAAVVFVWRPWLDPWWPGRDEIDSLPQACAVVERPDAAWLPPSAIRTMYSVHEDGAPFVNSACAYRSGPNTDGSGGIELELYVVRRTTLTGATEKARTDYAEAKESRAEFARQSPGGAEDGTAAMGDVAGLGDQAWQSVTVDRANGVTEVQLVIRRANVLVEVEHSARGPKEQVVSAADALAREALRRLDGR